MTISAVSDHQILPATPAAIATCAKALQQGQLVAFPTETVYGLGADAANDRAVAAVFAVKERPQFNPLIVHVADAKAAEQIVVMDDRACLLAETFWPGPLTLILPRRPQAKISLLVSAGLDTLAVRVPYHPVAQDLLAATGCPIAAPSANRSGRLTPTTPVHVVQSLGERVPYILAAGRTPVGLESTILDVSTSRPTILRLGAVLKEQIESLIGPVEVDVGPRQLSHRHLGENRGPGLPKRNGIPASAGMTDFRSFGVKSPGQLAKHYAPSISVRLNVEHVEKGEALLSFGPAFVTGTPAAHLNLSERGDLTEAAANLFATLHQLDQPTYVGIAVTPIPDVGLGLAINDRLRRAVGG